MWLLYGNFWGNWATFILPSGHTGVNPPLPIFSHLSNILRTNFIHFQNVLRELEQKKPQLDDLVKTAENLRESPIRQQIPEKGQTITIYFKAHSNVRNLLQITQRKSTKESG